MRSLAKIAYKQSVQLISPCLLYIFTFCIYIEATHLCGVLLYLKKHNIVSYWRMIGLELELTNDNLDIIESYRDSVEDCAMAMLHQWLASGRATKQALVEAVQEVK